MARLNSTLPPSAPAPRDASPAPLYVRLPDGRRWPCVLRRSARARRCRLRVDGHGMATLVVPQKSRSSQPALESLLQGFAPWLEKTLTRLLGPGAEPPPAATTRAADGRLTLAPVPTLADIPASISLPLSGMVWHIYMVDRGGAPERADGVVRLDGAEDAGGTDSAGNAPVRVTLHHEAHTCAGGGRIELRGPTEHPDFAGSCCLLLQRWLRGQAARWLPPHVRLLASRMGAKVGRITIRAQRGRWGSCSSRGDISLNCLLMLLPLPLLDHVCLHELCHLRHMDHSRQYRAYLALHAPHWQWSEKALNTAWRQMPTWAVWRG